MADVVPDRRATLWGWGLVLLALIGGGWALVAGQWLLAIVAAVLFAAGVLRMRGYSVGSLVELLAVGMFCLTGALISLYAIAREAIQREPGWLGLIFFLLLGGGVFAVLAWLVLSTAYRATKGDALAEHRE